MKSLPGWFFHEFHSDIVNTSVFLYVLQKINNDLNDIVLEYNIGIIEVVIIKSCYVY